MSKSFTLNNRRETLEVHGSAFSFPSKPYSPNPPKLVQLVASSTALLKASSSRFHHSTLLPLAAIFPAVRISNSSSLSLASLTLVADSTRSGWQRCRLEALTCSHVFELHRTSSSHRSRRSPGRHPVRAWTATGSGRASHRAPPICRAALYGKHVRFQEAVEGHRRQHRQL
jgi:hypothetical protein